MTAPSTSGRVANCARLASSRWFIALIDEAEKLWPHSSSVITLTCGSRPLARTSPLRAPPRGPSAPSAHIGTIGVTDGARAIGVSVPLREAQDHRGVLDTHYRSGTARVSSRHFGQSRCRHTSAPRELADQFCGGKQVAA